METRLKCPKCNRLIVSLRASVLCMKYFTSNVDGEDDDIVTTSTWTKDMGLGKYSCPHCEYTTGDIESFATQMECDCDHESDNEWEYNGGYEYNVCMRCGVITETICRDRDDW